ncbi:unnamed protein product [Lupinus luteus]|uniref:DRBM domain-containing protein n=1 Tax=Lupinus luteus TaxID=3873 RepID=A0AAV1YHY1_LUPLU
MYKTKLQELCHDRNLGLPKYYTMKDGPDHMPTFKATVYVNSVTFTSLATFTSSKQAQNQAAMLAFNALSSPPHDTGRPCKSQLQNYAQRSNPDPSIFSSKTEAEEAAAEVPLMSLSGNSTPFKNKLQELTQRKCFGKPTYKTTQSGSPTMPTFLSTVEVEGKEFRGKTAKSKKEARQNAAKVAYLALKECTTPNVDKVNL